VSASSTKLGIIGAGDFGRLLERLFSGRYLVQFADSRDLGLDNQVSLEELIQQSKVIFLAIPFSAYDTVLPIIAKQSRADCLVVDISSVKSMPEKKLEQHIPELDSVLLHPLFGPQSVPATSLKGHSLIVCSTPSPAAEHIIDHFVELGARRQEMTPKQHDISMAYTQSLTFFLGRGLTDLEIDHHEFATPSFERLLSLRALDYKHSNDLFETIQTANPYAADVRKRMIGVLQDINRRLNEE